MSCVCWFVCWLNERFWGCLKSHATTPLLEVQMRAVVGLQQKATISQKDGFPKSSPLYDLTISQMGLPICRLPRYRWAAAGQCDHHHGGGGIGRGLHKGRRNMAAAWTTRTAMYASGVRVCAYYVHLSLSLSLDLSTYTYTYTYNCIYTYAYTYTYIYIYICIYTISLVSCKLSCLSYVLYQCRSIFGNNQTYQPNTMCVQALLSCIYSKLLYNYTD